MRRRLPLLLTVAGAVGIAVGVALLVSAQDAGFGWTAYAPLSTRAPVVIVQPTPVGPVALALAGAAALGAGVALLFDHARRPRSAAGRDGR